MKYFIIAGEASGDLHASALIKSIKKHDTEAEFAFLGGDMMAEATQCKPIVHYRDMAFMGFMEVARHATKIMANFKAAKKGIREFMPDRLILIDYPSFNLKMASYAKKLGIPVSYYISPKVWAWKEWRVKKIRKVVDQMLAIFPFEVDFYRKHGMEVEYVGNPSVEEIDRMKALAPDRKDFIARNKLADKPIVALLPGSRLEELRTNLPIMTKVMRQFPQYRGVVAGAPGIDPSVYSQYTHLPVIEGQTCDLLANARAALVTSGTATLETALMQVPQVAMYRNNGYKIIRRLKDKVLSVKYITLPNLITDREIIPELIFDLCTPDAVAAELGKILPDRAARQNMLDAYAEMRRTLGESIAPDVAAEKIVQATAKS